MVRKRPQKTEELVQMYLMGELSGDLLEKFQRIDFTDNIAVLTKNEQTIKQCINKLRAVDEMLRGAADASFKMPPQLERQLNSILSNSSSAKKRKPNKTLEFLLSLITPSNFWSLMGGGVVASLCFFTVLRLNPAFLMEDPGSDLDLFVGESLREVERVGQAIRMARTKEDSDPGNLFGKVTLQRRLAEVEKKIDELNSQRKELSFLADSLVANEGSYVSEDYSTGIKPGSYTITDRLAFFASGLNKRDETASPAGDFSASIGRSFSLSILALKDIVLTVSYLSNDGFKYDLLSERKLKKGQTFLTKKWELAKPAGKDQILFISSDGWEHRIDIDVKN